MDFNRRLFLLGTTGAAARAFQSQTAVNTAMIGVGNRGSFLLQGVLKQPNARVAAVCDIKPDRLDKAASAAARDNPATYTDWQRMLERKDVDAVFIATPPYLHSEMAVHNLDLCNWSIGAHPVRACGFGGILKYKNEPPGRSIFDCGSITYEYPNGVKMSFTQNVFHPAATPGAGQYVYVYGTKGLVDLTNGTMYPADPKAEPVVLAPKQQEDQYAHISAFYESIVHGAPPPVDIRVGAAAALTAILGHQAMVQQKVVTWKDLGVDV